jgi:HSP20 family protein
MTLSIWSPSRELSALRQQLDRLFGDFYGDGAGTRIDAPVLLPIDVHQTDRELVVEASMAGFEPKDVQISVQNGMLTISAHKEAESEDKNKQYLRRERQSFSVYRELALPYDVEADKAKAEFEHGVLKLSLPKSQSNRPVRIPANGGSAKQVKDAQIN